MEKEGGGGERAYCEHVNVVDRKHGHKDVMKLNLQNISVHASFFRRGRPRPTQIRFLKRRRRRFEELVRTSSELGIKASEKLRRSQMRLVLSPRGEPQQANP